MKLANQARPTLLLLASVGASLGPSVAFAQDVASGQRAASLQEVTPFPAEAWPVAAPAERGLDPAPLAELDRAAGAGRYGHVDRILVVKDGYLVLNGRYENDYAELARHKAQDASDTLSGGGEPGEYNYYDPERHPFYRGREVHSLQSVTKSVSSTLIGIAIGQGKIAGTDAPLLSFFEEYEVDPRLAEATLADLLTMRSGIAWNESGLDESNTTLQLEHSDDWIRFTFAQPIDAAPGEKWVYNSGGSHLMSGVIEAATGVFIDEFAREHLFGPLGIDDFHWKKDPQGYPDTEGGLYLRAEDLARFGYLFLRGGRWRDRQVVPADWVAAATARQVERVAADGRGYGYQWWRLDRGAVAVWAGLGFGGQYLLVLPSLDVVAVASSWNLYGPAQPVLGPLLDAVLAAAR